MPASKRRIEALDGSAPRKKRQTRSVARSMPSERKDPVGADTAEPEEQASKCCVDLTVTQVNNEEHVQVGILGRLSTILNADKTSQTLKLLQGDFDILRQTLTCKICEKLFYEPYLLSCGHTFCYRCLSTWFSSVPSKKMSCPNCREQITQAPAPSYAIKDMVGIFMQRAELLPDGETVEEHEAWKKEEEEHLAAEKNNASGGGIFKGRFRVVQNVIRPVPVRDPGDDILRCAQCNWELDDDVCVNCGINYGATDGSFSGSDFAGGRDADGELHHWYPAVSSRDSDSGSDHSDDAAYYSRPLRYYARPAQSRNYTNRPTFDAGAGREIGGAGYHDYGVQPHMYSDVDSEDDEDAGSLVDFVVDELDGGAQSPITVSSGDDSGSDSDPHRPYLSGLRPTASRIYAHRRSPRRSHVIGDSEDETGDSHSENGSEDGSGYDTLTAGGRLRQYGAASHGSFEVPRRNAPGRRALVLSDTEEDSEGDTTGTSTRPSRTSTTDVSDVGDDPEPVLNRAQARNRRPVIRPIWRGSERARQAAEARGAAEDTGGGHRQQY